MEFASGGPARIRPFAEADTEAVVALWRRAGLTRPWNDPYQDITRKLAVQRELFLVADTDVVVGSAMFGYEGHRGWVNYLAVDPAHRGRGVGRALMAEGERLLRDLGCPKLNLQVRGDNTEAAAFYERLGYERGDVVSYGRRLVED